MRNTESIVETLVSRDYSESEHVVPEGDHHIPLHTYITWCAQFGYRTVLRASALLCIAWWCCGLVVGPQQRRVPSLLCSLRVACRACRLDTLLQASDPYMRPENPSKTDPNPFGVSLGSPDIDLRPPASIMGRYGSSRAPAACSAPPCTFPPFSSVTSSCFHRCSRHPFLLIRVR